VGGPSFLTGGLWQETSQNLLKLGDEFTCGETLPTKHLAFLVTHLETDILEQVFAGSSDAARKVQDELTKEKTCEETRELQTYDIMELLHIQALAATLKMLAIAIVDTKADTVDTKADKFLHAQLASLRGSYLELNRRLTRLEHHFDTDASSCHSVHSYLACCGVL